MRVGVVGTGYVGLVTGTCFAEMSHNVTCVDVDAEKVARMEQGEVPIHEPGLQEYFDRGIREGRLQFSTELESVLGSEAIFLALPTPPGEQGEADLSYIYGVASDLGRILTDYTVVVNKSTVPIGTAVEVRKRIAENAQTDFDVVSNPEFLREGSAVYDFMHPDRVVIGSSSDRATGVMRELYRPVVRTEPERIIVTDEASAELSKYGANAILAARISFMNELAKVAEVTGANIDDVRDIMGKDGRIGERFLFPGPGYGGSCFPKDTRALVQMAGEHDIRLDVVSATIEANDRQKRVLPEMVLEYFEGDVSGKTFAVWGLAFKDNTDDVRESPAFDVVDILTEKGAKIVAFDPEASANFQKERPHNGKITYVEDMYRALDRADGLIIVTNWKEFYNPDFEEVRKRMISPVIFDGRNLYEIEMMASRDIHYRSIGRPTVKPRLALHDKA